MANDGASGMPANATANEGEMQISDAVRLRLRALVRCLDNESTDDASEQMLMDIDLDGQRYLLIRMPAVAPKGVSLSPREVEIVRLVAEGHQNKVIASVLEISSWTVCTHMRRVFAKFGVTSRAAMVARVAALGGIVDGTLPSLPRGGRQGGRQGEDETPPHRLAARDAMPVRRSASGAALALQRCQGGPREADNSAERAAARRQAISHASPLRRYRHGSGDAAPDGDDPQESRPSRPDPTNLEAVWGYAIERAG
jgi:DNA-binding CsgD family transcriptional regulator